MVLLLSMLSVGYANRQEQIAEIESSINELNLKINRLIKAKKKREEEEVKQREQDMKKFVTSTPVFTALFTNSPATFVREHILLDAIADNTIEVQRLYIGARLQPFIHAASGETDDKSLTFIGTRLAIISRMSDYVTGYFSINGADQTVTPWYNYLLIGNTAKFPVYGLMGFKYLDFGSMPRYTSIIAPIIRTFWITKTRQVEFGYRDGIGGNGLNLQLTAFNGEESTGTNPSQISNFAINGFYKFEPIKGLTVKPGAGYLNGMAHKAKLPDRFNSVIMTQENERSPAWDAFLNGVYKFGDSAKSQLRYNFEYTSSVYDTLNSEKTKAWMLGLKYSSKAFFGKKVKLSVTQGGLKANGIMYHQWLFGAGIVLAGISYGLDYSRVEQSNDIDDNAVNLSFTFNMN